MDAVLRALVDGGALVETKRGFVATGPLRVPGYVVDLFGVRLDDLEAPARSVVATFAVADGPLVHAKRPPSSGWPRRRPRARRPRRSEQCCSSRSRRASGA